eukprot:6481399-Amphidinium_carterae.1
MSMSKPLSGQNFANAKLFASHRSAQRCCCSRRKWAPLERMAVAVPTRTMTSLVAGFVCSPPYPT